MQRIFSVQSVSTKGSSFAPSTGRTGPSFSAYDTVYHILRDKKRIPDSLQEILATAAKITQRKGESHMKNTNRQPSSGSVLLGMAAGAPWGPWAPWQWHRTSGRSSAPHAKLAKGGGTRHEPAGYHGHGSRGAQDGSVREKQKAGPAGSAFCLPFTSGSRYTSGHWC